MLTEEAFAFAKWITCTSKGNELISDLIWSSSASDTITSKIIPASWSICFLLSDPDARIIGSFG